jgi:ABC-2 type transport system permease protein
MAQNTSVNKVVGFRFLFRYLLLNLFVTAQLISGLAIFGRGALSAPSLTGVLSLIWLYTAFWFALSYWINSYKRSSGFNATALTGSWLLLVLVVPTIISTSVDLLHPLPSRLDLITHARNVSDSLAKNANALSRFLEEHPEFKPAKPGREDRNAVSLRNRIEVEMAVEKARASFDAVVQKRETVVNNYRFLSPAIFIQQSLNKAAGTNDDRFKAFGKEVAAFQKNYRSFFEPLIYRQEKFTVAHLDKVPSFPTQSTLLPVAANRQLLADHLFLATLIATLLTVALFKWKGTSKSKVTSTVQNNNLNLSRRKKELVQDAVEDLP